ncbi:MAG: hypothetical protein HDS52_08525 [Barnesiella sp.]|nr:hypothetical protein [Barnesiella sp.]
MLKQRGGAVPGRTSHKAMLNTVVGPSSAAHPHKAMLVLGRTPQPLKH